MRKNVIGIAKRTILYLCVNHRMEINKNIKQIVYYPEH